MGTLRIDGEPNRELSRDSYDLGRKNLLEPKAVCHAPFGALHVGARIGPCRHGTADLGDPASSSLAQAFAGGAADALRERFRRYEVRRDECSRCIHHWEDQSPADSPAQREFDRELPPVNGVPPRLLSLSLDTRVELPEPRLAEVRTLLPQLERFTLLCATLAKGSVAERLAGDIDALRRDPRPQLKLIAVGFVPSAAEVPPCTAAVEVELPIAPLAPDARERLADLADDLKERATTLVVRGALGRSNWAALRQFFAEVRACGCAVAVEPLARDHADSLAALDGDLLALVHDVCWRFGSEAGIASDERHCSAELRALLRRLREWQGAAADRAGPGATLSFPSLDHPLLADERATRWLLEDALRAWHHPQVGDWFGQLVATPRFADAAPSRLSLRLVALWRRVAFERPELDPLLRSIWQDARIAAERIAADRRELHGTPLLRWHDDWVRSLTLEIRPRGGTPFAPPTAAPPSHGRAEVTIVIPSFNHERYVGQAIESALAQVGANVRVLVVDDASTDQTAAVARQRRDPRLVVRRNHRNFGLGRSFRRALARVRTPYVAILNSDDFFHPQRIERLLAALKAQPGANVAASLVVPVDAAARTITPADTSPIFDGRKIHDWVRWHSTSGAAPADDTDLLGSLFERNWLVSSSNLLCRRDWLLRRADQWQDLEYCVDWQLFLLAAAKGELCVVREPLLGYRLHGTNTVWFDEQRAWRFYIESHRVIARALESRLHGIRDQGARGRFDAMLQLVARHVAVNRDLDWAGIWLGLLLERLRIPSAALSQGGSAELLKALERARKNRLDAASIAAAIGDDLIGTLRDRSDAAWLRRDRQRGEALAGELVELRGQLRSALEERRNFERQWRQAERERDAQASGAAELQRRIGLLDHAVDAARADAEYRAELLAQREREAQANAVELEQLQATRNDLASSLETLQREHERARLDIEEAKRLLGAEQRQAQGSLSDALAAMDRGDAKVRGELGQALLRLQVERERVESGLADVLEQSVRDRAESRLAADREREILVGARDRLHEQVAELEIELTRARRQARDAEAQTLMRERAAAEERIAALMADEALARQAIEQEAQRSRAAMEQLLLGARREVEQHAAAVAQDAAAVEQRAADLAESLALTRADLAQQKQLVQQRTWERDDLKRQPEWRLGELALKTLPLKKPLRFAEKKLSKLKSVWAARSLRAERRGWLGLKSAPTKPRVMATICWNFPIYSQTFVYQELMQLRKRGFDLRVSYSKLDPKDRLHAQFAPLWDLKRPMHLDRPVHEADFRLYKQRFPDRVETLIHRLCAASGLDREKLEAHDNFLQGFTYARLVEAWGADYLHSYFFYDRSLMSLIAGEVLDLPHGVSCYADHVMKDYELKVVPLHLETCAVVVATSHRIKRELLELAPGTDPDKIVVKPNAVDCTRFPVIPRPEPAPDQPFRLVVTSRIEPKKGLIHLVEAIKLLRDQGVSVEAHFVGDCDHGVPASENYKAELCARIERHQLWGRIHLEGRQPEQKVRHFLAIGHLFVAPFVETESGDKDGIPTALIEAMATGIPSVVTDAGSILEVVDDRVDARVVPQKDAAALAAAIRELLEDPHGRQAMGRKAAQKAREKFDVSVCDPWFHERVHAALAARRKA